jgi:hypothetical protein
MIMAKQTQANSGALVLCPELQNSIRREVVRAVDEMYIHSSVTFRFESLTARPFLPDPRVKLSRMLLNLLHKLVYSF